MTTDARARVGLFVAGTLLAALALSACAPATAPLPVVSAPRYPDFVYPAPPPRLARGRQAARLEEGWQMLQAGETARARQAFAAALRAGRGFYPAEAALGYVSLADRNYADAIARFGRALGPNPRYVPALVGRGDALAAADRLDDAIRDLRAALAVDASMPDVRRRLEVLTFRREQHSLEAARRAAAAGRLDEAAAAYERAIERSPDSALLYRELAAVEQRQGRTDEAVARLRKAVSLDPNDARALTELGGLLEAGGDYGAAAEAYARAVRIDPSPETRARLEAARAAGGASKLPPQFQAIARAPRITRGDLAALIGLRLRPLLESAPDRASAVVTDLRGQWAAPYILAVVRAGVMEPYPNHAFVPGGEVSRLALARAASRVLGLVEARHPGIAHEWRAARPRVADVPPDHLGYPAVALVVGAGVMSLDDRGAFGPGRAVSGAEAMDVVRRLEGLSR